MYLPGSTITGCLRARARAGSNHYFLVSPDSSFEHATWYLCPEVRQRTPLFPLLCDVISEHPFDHDNLRDDSQRPVAQLISRVCTNLNTFGYNTADILSSCQSNRWSKILSCQGFILAL